MRQRDTGTGNTEKRRLNKNKENPYKLAMNNAMQILEVSKLFPKEERYNLPLILY